MQELYGKHASAIMSLEASLQLNYDKNCDLRQPTFWPSIPLKFWLDCIDYNIFSLLKWGIWILQLSWLKSVFLTCFKFPSLSLSLFFLFSPSRKRRKLQIWLLKPRLIRLKNVLINLEFFVNGKLQGILETCIWAWGFNNSSLIIFCFPLIHSPLIKASILPSPTP